MQSSYNILVVNIYNVHMTITGALNTTSATNWYIECIKVVVSALIVVIQIRLIPTPGVLWP